MNRKTWVGVFVVLFVAALCVPAVDANEGCSTGEPYYVSYWSCKGDADASRSSYDTDKAERNTYEGLANDWHGEADTYASAYVSHCDDGGQCFLDCGYGGTAECGSLTTSPDSRCNGGPVAASLYDFAANKCSLYCNWAEAESSSMHSNMLDNNSSANDAEVWKVMYNAHTYDPDTSTVKCWLCYAAHGELTGDQVTYVNCECFDCIGSDYLPH